MTEPVFKLEVYAKNNLSTPVATGETTGTAITGLAAGTVISDGDYVVFGVDESGDYAKSQMADVPGFTVLGSATIPVTGITVSPSTANGEPGGTQVFTATVEPANATEQGVLWSIDDNSIATISAGTASLRAAGTTTVKATSKADSTIVGTATLTVNAPS